MTERGRLRLDSFSRTEVDRLLRLGARWLHTWHPDRPPADKAVVRSGSVTHIHFYSSPAGVGEGIAFHWQPNNNGRVAHNEEIFLDSA